MHYEGIIYRPPFEARSLLLQVTTGCSHNKCNFCTMYRDVPFKVSPLDEVEEDLQEVAPYARGIRRVFLEGGDAFALSGDQLIRIAEMINSYLPYVETITMYASINNIKSKTDDELARLLSLGIDDLNIGLESGDDEALAYMNKGYTAAEALEQLERLNEIGMKFCLNLILGAKGKGFGEQGARLTAELVNKVQPHRIFIGTIHADHGCSLYEDMHNGDFIECSIREYMEEERQLIEKLELRNCIFFGLHPSNVVQMQGYLPEDKDKLLSLIDDAEAQYSDALLDKSPLRGGEGAALIF